MKSLLPMASLADQPHSQRQPWTISCESLHKYLICRRTVTYIHSLHIDIQSHPPFLFAQMVNHCSQWRFSLKSRLNHSIHTKSIRSLSFILKLYHILLHGCTIKYLRNSLLKRKFSLLPNLRYFHYYLLTRNSLGEFDCFFNRVWVHHFI